MKFMHGWTREEKKDFFIGLPLGMLALVAIYHLIWALWIII